MKFWNFGNKEIEKVNNTEIATTYEVYVNPKWKLDEQFKGEVAKTKKVFPKDLGEEHPFSFEEMEKLYTTFGFAKGVVDKYVDFIWGSGFFVTSENENAQKIIEDWVRDVDFATLGRHWVREAVNKGSGFLELAKEQKTKSIGGAKVLNANYMYVNRDDKGEVVVYKQFVKRPEDYATQRDKVIEFAPDEIAHLTISLIGDSPYGYGIIYPGMNDINNLLSAEKEMHTLMRRKANTPIVAKMGDLERGDIPSATDINAFGAKLEWLHNKHEWAIGPNIELKTLDFGRIGEKFEAILAHDNKMLFFTFQVPEVLMGAGNIAEGLAKVQLDAFQRTVQSIQLEIEKIMEQKIFKVILQANGINAHVEVNWGEPSDEEVNERITKLTEILKLPMLSRALQKQVELDLARQLGYDEEQLEVDMEGEEIEREKELERQQPEVPGVGKKEMIKPTIVPIVTIEHNHSHSNVYENVEEQKSLVIQTLLFDKTKFDKPSAKSWAKEHDFKSSSIDEGDGYWRLRQRNPEEFIEDSFRTFDVTTGIKAIGGKLKKNESVEDWSSCLRIHEWLGFNFIQYKQFINKYITEDDFNLLLAKTEEEVINGKLSEAQVRKLKQVLITSFNDNLTLREIENKIRNEVKPKDLYAEKDGEKVLRMSSNVRSAVIARSEVTRVTAEGAILYYKDSGADKLQFMSSLGSRTCQICNDLNGKLFTIKESMGVIPVHSNCRCAWVNIGK